MRSRSSDDDCRMCRDDCYGRTVNRSSSLSSSDSRCPSTIQYGGARVSHAPLEWVYFDVLWGVHPRFGRHLRILTRLAVGACYTKLSKRLSVVGALQAVQRPVPSLCAAKSTYSATKLHKTWRSIFIPHYACAGCRALGNLIGHDANKICVGHRRPHVAFSRSSIIE